METIHKDKYFLMHADCVPIRGFKRSCVYDLTRRKYYFIPNALAEILNKYNRLPISKLYRDFDNSPILDEYFKFLFEKEIIYQADEWELEHFPSLKLEWRHPSKVSSAIIDVDETSRFDCSKISVLFDKLGVKHLQIRQVSFLPSDFINQLLLSLNDSRLKSIELILPYDENYLNNSNAFKKANPKVLLIYFFEAVESKSIIEPKLPRVFLTKDSIHSLSVEKSPNPKYFAVNVQLFTEAQHYQVFYNRKLFVDKQGQLKNSLFSSKAFGHIDSIDVATVIDTREFQEYWFVEKDKTAVCKDCEFRYMCTDQRIPVKSGDGWTHTIHCRYNPYIAKWDWEKGFEFAPSNVTSDLHENQIN